MGTDVLRRFRVLGVFAYLAIPADAGGSISAGRYMSALPNIPAIAGVTQTAIVG